VEVGKVEIAESEETAMNEETEMNAVEDERFVPAAVVQEMTTAKMVHGRCPAIRLLNPNN
jgi:hypothetical protein